MRWANKPPPSLEDVRKLEEEAIRKRKQEREDKRQERKKEKWGTILAGAGLIGMFFVVFLIDNRLDLFWAGLLIFGAMLLYGAYRQWMDEGE